MKRVMVIFLVAIAFTGLGLKESELEYLKDVKEKAKNLLNTIHRKSDVELHGVYLVDDFILYNYSASYHGDLTFYFVKIPMKEELIIIKTYNLDELLSDLPFEMNYVYNKNPFVIFVSSFYSQDTPFSFMEHYELCFLKKEDFDIAKCFNMEDHETSISTSPDLDAPRWKLYEYVDQEKPALQSRIKVYENIVKKYIMIKVIDYRYVVRNKSNMKNNWKIIKSAKECYNYNFEEVECSDDNKLILDTGMYYDKGSRKETKYINNSINIQ